jgi:hypothetical protein
MGESENPLLLITGYITGIKNRVITVAEARPPRTASPMGAVIIGDLPGKKAIGERPGMVVRAGGTGTHRLPGGHPCPKASPYVKYCYVFGLQTALKSVAILPAPGFQRYPLVKSGYA